MAAYVVKWPCGKPHRNFLWLFNTGVTLFFRALTFPVRVDECVKVGAEEPDEPWPHDTGDSLRLSPLI